MLDLDIGIAEAAASKTDEGRDGVLQVGDFLVLCGLADVTALWAKANQRTVWRLAEIFGGRAVNIDLRSRAVGDLVGNLENVSSLENVCESAHAWCTYDVDATVARNSDNAVERAQINAHNRHVYRWWRGISKKRLKKTGRLRGQRFAGGTASGVVEGSGRQQQEIL